MGVKILYRYFCGIVLIIFVSLSTEAMGFKFSKNSNVKVRSYYEGNVMFHEFIHARKCNSSEIPGTIKTFVLNDRYNPRGISGNKSKNNVIKSLNGYKGKVWKSYVGGRFVDNKWYKQEVIYEAGAVRFIHSNMDFALGPLTKFNAILYDKEAELKMSSDSIRKAFALVMDEDELPSEIDCVNDKAVSIPMIDSADDVDKIMKYADAMFSHILTALDSDYSSIEAINAMTNDMIYELKDMNEPISDFSIYTKAANAPLCEFCEAMYLTLIEALNPCNASDMVDVNKVCNHIRSRVELVRKSVHVMLGIDADQAVMESKQRSLASEPESLVVLFNDGNVLKQTDLVANEQVQNKRYDIFQSDKLTNENRCDWFGLPIPWKFSLNKPSNLVGDNFQCQSDKNISEYSDSGTKSVDLPKSGDDLEKNIKSHSKSSDGNSVDRSNRAAQLSHSNSVLESFNLPKSGGDLEKNTKSDPESSDGNSMDRSNRAVQLSHSNFVLESFNLPKSGDHLDKKSDDDDSEEDDDEDDDEEEPDDDSSNKGLWKRKSSSLLRKSDLRRWNARLHNNRQHNNLRRSSITRSGKIRVYTKNGVKYYLPVDGK
ncbi:MAG: hypothetical protein LBH49_01510 [Puniceicoccales bacterium]|jgi:hypothetical protein|nr:hypothetical protein [Puniceicoccales bacterium]